MSSRPKRKRINDFFMCPKAKRDNYETMTDRELEELYLSKEEKLREFRRQLLEMDEQQRHFVQFMELPRAIVGRILSMLDIPSALSASRACRRFADYFKANPVCVSRVVIGENFNFVTQRLDLYCDFYDRESKFVFREWHSCSGADPCNVSRGRCPNDNEEDMRLSASKFWSAKHGLKITYSRMPSMRLLFRTLHVVHVDHGITLEKFTVWFVLRSLHRCTPLSRPLHKLFVTPFVEAERHKTLFEFLFEFLGMKRLSINLHTQYVSACVLQMKQVRKLEELSIEGENGALHRCLLTCDNLDALVNVPTFHLGISTTMITERYLWDLFLKLIKKWVDKVGKPLHWSLSRIHNAVNFEKIESLIEDVREMSCVQAKQMTLVSSEVLVNSHLRGGDGYLLVDTKNDRGLYIGSKFVLDELRGDELKKMAIEKDVATIEKEREVTAIKEEVAVIKKEKKVITITSIFSKMIKKAEL